MTIFRTPSVVALLSMFVALAPAFAAAQTPSPAGNGTHPNVAPPTAAPAKRLPATPLPNGSLTAPATTSATAAPAAETGLSVLPGGVTPYALIAAGVIILAGIGWFLRPHKDNPTPFEPTAG